MPYDKPYLQQSRNPYDKEGIRPKLGREIYYGTVVSNTDETDGGRIKVRIPFIDNNINDENLVWSQPLMPKYIHVIPQVNEMVWVFIDQPMYPQRNRLWLGGIISQPQFIGLDTYPMALSTTPYANTKPEAAPSTYPDAKGVYPTNDDIGIVGRVNTDIILRTNELHFRAGKHEDGNPLKLNTKNPSTISMVFEPQDPNVNPATFRSSTLVLSDKIGLITHDGNPKFKAVNINSEDRDKIFENGHPIARGDVLVEALNIIRRTLINHIHGYNSLPPDKNTLIQDLEKIDFDAILQKNIVIN